MATIPETAGQVPGAGSSEEIHHCKKCEKILEEGRAYELGGNRWHVDCFRCSNCETQLDCDTNLLVLGNGNLICNNCSYRCHVCNRKIEDLAILTGNHAFCSSCFSCRNCKKKIDDLRYARTSQGIFCMTCHETLLARKKRHAARKAAQQQQLGLAQQQLEKQLHTQQHHHHHHPRQQSINFPLPGYRASMSPASSDSSNRYDTRLARSSCQSFEGMNRTNHQISLKEKSLPSLPVEEPQEEATTIRLHDAGSRLSKIATLSNSSAHSTASHNDNNATRGLRNSFHNYSGSSKTELLIFTSEKQSQESAFVPLTLDSNSLSPQVENDIEARKKRRSGFIVSSEDSNRFSRNLEAAFGGDDLDAASIIIQLGEIDNAAKEPTEHVNKPEAQLTLAPEIKDSRPEGTPRIETDAFESRGAGPLAEEPPDSNLGPLPRADTDIKIVLDDDDILPKIKVPEEQQESPIQETKKIDEPILEIEHDKKEVTERDSEPEAEIISSPRTTRRDAKIQHPAARTAIYLNYDLSQESSIHLPDEDGAVHTEDQDQASPGSATKTLRLKPLPLEFHLSPSDNDGDFERLIPERSGMRPRSPLPPLAPSSPTTEGSPAALRETPKTPVNQSPQTSIDGGSMSDVLQRECSVASELSNVYANMVGTDTKYRSVSKDTGTPGNSYDGGLSTLGNTYSLFDRSESKAPAYDTLTKELVEAKKRIATLERMLQDAQEVCTPAPGSLEDDIKKKRKTIAGLEAQGVVARMELQLLEGAKNKPRQTSKLVEEFSSELQGVKEQLMEEISELVARKEKLIEENAQLEKAIDKAVEESSLLNIKNSQLADMNNELTRELIEKFGAKAAEKEKAVAGRRKDTTTPHMPELLSSPGHGHGDEPMVTILDAGQVVDTRKDRQHPRRFWKRPGAAVAKGLNRVFATEESTEEVDTASVASPNISSGGLGIMFPPKDAKTVRSARNGWFKNSNNSAGPDSGTMSTSNSSNTLATTSPGSPSKIEAGSANQSTLMRVPIDVRLGIEKKKVPTIVTKCIEEVEKRGMLFEGIYRKSGGKSQIVAIEEAFEKSWDGDFTDILSEGEISGVTSALKQYLRYLPIPLITYEAYSDFISCGNITDVKLAIEKMRKIILALPIPHRDCLEVVVRHLAKVALHSDVNLMSAKNLAVVFAPTLARDSMGEKELDDMQRRSDCTQLLIEHVDFIFGDMNVL